MTTEAPTPLTPEMLWKSVRRLRRWALSRDPRYGEDDLQDAALATWQRRDQIRGVPTAYLMISTRHRKLDREKVFNPLGTYTDYEKLQLVAPEPEEGLPTVTEILARLSPRSQKVLRMLYVENLTQEETAAGLGACQTAVSKWKRWAIREAREAFREAA